MTRNKSRGVQFKGPYKVKRIRRRFGKQEKIDIEVSYYYASPDHRSLKNFRYSYLPPPPPEDPALTEKSFLPE